MTAKPLLREHDDRLSPLKKLIVHAHTFDFAQAVYLLQCVRPHHRLGDAHPFAHEPVRFQSVYSFKGQQPDLSFVWVPITQHPRDVPPQPVIMVNFLSLLGVQGPLPYEMSEVLINESLRHQHPDQQKGLHAFFDIFHHRLITLWFKLFCKLHPLLRQHTYGESLTRRILQHFVPHHVNDHDDTRAMMISSAALFWQRSRSAVGLEIMLRGIFQVPCRLRVFEGGWNTGRIADATRLGSAFNILGKSVILGHRTFDQRKGFSIVLGPMPYAHAEHFFPTHTMRNAHTVLKYIQTQYLQNAHDISLRLLIQADDMPKLILKRNGGVRLGYTTHLKQRDTHSKNRVYEVQIRDHENL